MSRPIISKKYWVFGFFAIQLVALALFLFVSHFKNFLGSEVIPLTHLGQAFVLDFIPVVDLYDDVMVEYNNTLGVFVHKTKNQISHKRKEKFSIAIGGGITSHGQINVTPYNVAEKFSLFTTFIPSFCATCDRSTQVTYAFYLGYDWTDEVFGDANFLSAFRDAFEGVLANCGPNVIATLTLVECGHSNSPAWAQNDAMMAAYMDDNDYYYRINDDTIFQSAGWLGAFVATLEKYDPPNVGVVGPMHSGGYSEILTYDFVHRTHIDLFGFYYPRVFTDWYADEWMTKVYAPNRSTKLHGVTLVHTMSLGQRYSYNRKLSEVLSEHIEHDRMLIKRYIESKERPHFTIDRTKVVTLSLYGSCRSRQRAIIRTAQLVPVLFPGWLLRVYAISPTSTNTSLLVPHVILTKLKSLGAEIVFVESKLGERLCPSLWPLLALHDAKINWLVYSHDDEVTNYDVHDLDEGIQTVKNSDAPVHCLHSDDERIYDSFRSGGTCPSWCDGRRSERMAQTLLCSSKVGVRKSVFGNNSDFDLATKLIRSCNHYR